MPQSSLAAAWSGAAALKRHCHNMINVLGPLTPPEAFLYRGNAYYAMGMPYFALADYNTAASVLNLSGDHQRRCSRVMRYMPETQTATYPSTDSHLHIFVKPMLSKRCSIAVVDDLVGRGLLATEMLPRGSLVVRAAPPWMLYPTEDGLCSFCGVPLPDRSFACANEDCHEEYCSRECRAEALSLYHGAVCTNSAFQSIELDVYAQRSEAVKNGSTAELNAAAAQLLMLRVIAAAMQAHVVPSAMGPMRILSGRLTFSPQALAGPLLHLYERLARALHISTILSYEEMIGVLARTTANCFHRDGAVELNLPRAMLNHSCEANVAENAETGDMVTTTDVPGGAELTINYYPHLKDLAYTERSEELHRRGFDCQCCRCKRRE